MLVRYISVWKLHGASRLEGEEQSLELARFDRPNLSAILTSDPEPHCFEVDQANACATQILKAVFAPDKEGSPEERIAAEQDEVAERRRRKFEKGLFLVFIGEAQVTDPDFRLRRDLDGFAICFDAIDKDALRDKFQHLIRTVITATQLSLDLNWSHRVERVGDAIYLFDADHGKRIYTFTEKVGPARASLAGIMDVNRIETANKSIKGILENAYISKSMNLLVKSTNHGASELQAFISAWSALEIFINTAFKNRYKQKWYDAIEEGASLASRRAFERFKNVLKDKYRLSDRFLVVSDMLIPDEAVKDAEEFNRLKKIWDDFLHGSEVDSALPTEAIQRLHLKYMKAHFDHLAVSTEKEDRQTAIATDE